MCVVPPNNICKINIDDSRKEKYRLKWVKKRDGPLWAVYIKNILGGQRGLNFVKNLFRN